MFGNVKYCFALANIASSMHSSVIFGIVSQFELVEFCAATLHPVEHRVKPKSLRVVSRKIGV